MGSACCLTANKLKLNQIKPSDFASESQSKPELSPKKAIILSARSDFRVERGNKMEILATPPSVAKNDEIRCLNQRSATTNNCQCKVVRKESNEEMGVRPKRKRNTTVMNNILAFHKELIIEPIRIKMNSNLGKKNTAHMVTEGDSQITTNFTPVIERVRDCNNLSTSQLNILY